MDKHKAIPQGYMTVGEVAKKMDVTVRTLQHYDREGLLSPSAMSEGGRRLYTDKDIIKLHQILSLKHLGFSLDDIKNRLISLDTPAEIAAVLTEQADAVKKKIDSLSESLRELEALREKQDALVITAPCDGRIASLDVSVGDTVESGTLLLSLVEDGAGMTLTLSVDELDIVSVEPGQAAVIEPDALEGVTLTGTVEKIAPLGDTTTAVTTYDVTIALNSVDERVMAGMNVSGEIVVDTAEEALLIPTDALSKRDGVCTVTLRDGTVHEVTVGLMTRDQVQILSGLSEGDTVIY